MGIVAIVRVAAKGGSPATRVMQHSVTDLVASGKRFEEQVRLAAVGHQIQVRLAIVEVELGRTRESVLRGLACRGIWFFFTHAPFPLNNVRPYAIGARLNMPRLARRSG